MPSLLKIKFIGAICFATLLIAGNNTMSASAAAALVLPVPQSEQSPAADPADAQQRYQDELEKTRELVKKCRFISINFFDGSLAKSYQWKTDWAEASTELAAQKPILEKAALEWFNQCQQPSKELVQLAGTIASQLNAEGQFEGALKIFKKVKPHFPIEDDVELEQMLALLSIKTNHFEDAVEFMNRKDARESVEKLESQIDKNMFHLAPLLIDKWQPEKKLRQQEAESDDLPRVKLQLTSGDVVVELFENEAPETVANFIELVESGFYDGSLFHPVVKGLSAQTGNLFRTQPAKIDYVIKNESRLPNRRSHFAGVLTMSSAQNGIDSANVGFSITLIPNPDLDWDGREEDAVSQSVFGRVLSGIEHVAALPATLEVDLETGEQKVLRDVEPEQIEKAIVIRKRDHEYTFEKRQTGK